MRKKYFTDEEVRLAHQEKSNRRYYRLKQQAIDFLGGKCSKCGSDDRLRVNGKDPNKPFSISVLVCIPWELTEQILPSCELLCHTCYYLMRRAEFEAEPGGHGEGVSGRHNCKCDKCRPLKSQYQREWRKRQKEKRQQLTQ